MKLTSPLHRHNVYRWFQLKWRIQGQKKINELPLPKDLAEKGIKVSDVHEVAFPNEPLPIVPVPEPWAPPIPYDSTHPQWKQKMCYMFVPRTKILEGFPQAQLLTKTLIFEGLPKSIRSSVGVFDRPDQDDLVQKAILLARQWDGAQLRLPRKIDLARPGFRFPTQFGIPVRRCIKTLVRNMIKLLESQSGVYEDAFHRTHLTDTTAIVTSVKDNDLIQFEMAAYLMVTAKDELEPFASLEEVTLTPSASLPDLYPMKCTVDIPQKNIYDIKNIYPVLRTAAHPYLHTLYAIQREKPPLWTKSQALSRGLVTCFTYAMAQAKALYGENVKDLPRPVAIQCVLCSQDEVTFMAYQLNTMDLDSNNSVKNMAWLEAHMKLYDRCDEVNGKVVFEGYNPEVYKHLLAFHFNGLSTTTKAFPPLPITNLDSTKE